MNYSFNPDDLNILKRYFQTGVTRSISFRKEQLKKLKQAILEHEASIATALYTDLKRNREQSYATETGLLIAEINVALKNLQHWMRPQDAGTDLVNLPSSTTVYRDPLGVVLVISPWNYPLQLLLIPLVGAIAGGNCVVLKPSEAAPATAIEIEKIVTEIFSPEYIKVVQGDGSEVVPAMMKNFRFDHVFYTGSIPVGRAIYKLAAEQLVPVTLELGGKSPAIVEKDADIPVAARRISLGKFLNAGQSCIAPDYVLVHSSVKERFIDKMKEAVCHIVFYTTAAYAFTKIIFRTVLAG